MRYVVVLLALLAVTACGGQGGPQVAGGPSEDGTVRTASSSPSPTVSPAGTPSPVTTEVGTREVSRATPPSRPSPSVASSSPTSGDEYVEPPRATISGASGSLVLERGSYCWSQGPGRAGLCADTVGPGEQTPGFETSPDETLTLSFDIDQAPSRAEISVWPVDDDGRRTQVPLDPTNPTTYEVSLEAGSYYAGIFTVWEQGDASYHVRLDVS